MDLSKDHFVLTNQIGGTKLDHWISWIPDVGFPILVTFYLLHRIEKRLEELNESIIQLPEKINGWPS